MMPTRSAMICRDAIASLSEMKARLRAVLIERLR
jgi:hypothetical protein